MRNNEQILIAKFNAVKAQL